MRRLTPLAAGAIIVAIGALLYGWSVWGNGFLVFRGGGETGDVAANGLGSDHANDAVVGVVSRDPDPLAPAELAEPESGAEANLDSKSVRLDRPAPVQEPASAGLDDAPEMAADAASEPATDPEDESMTVAALPDTPPAEPVEAHQAVQAEAEPSAKAEQLACPVPIAGVAPPGDPACEAIADASAPGMEKTTPRAVEDDMAMTESATIAELSVPEKKVAATPEAAARQTDKPAAPAAADDEITVARLSPEVLAAPEAATDVEPNKGTPTLRSGGQAVDDPVAATAPTFDIVRVAPGGTQQSHRIAPASPTLTMTVNGWSVLFVINGAKKAVSAGQLVAWWRILPRGSAFTIVPSTMTPIAAPPGAVGRCKTQ